MVQKNCDFKGIKQEDLLITKLLTDKIDEKLREKLFRKNH